MSEDLKGPTIAVIGKADSGKTTFIRAVCNTASGTPGEYTVYQPTSEIVKYRVPLSGGLFMTFLDTPGFDGNLANSENATTEGILNSLEKYVTDNNLSPITYTLFFLNTSDMTMSEFTVLPRRAFERIFQSSQVACITACWDRMEFENEAPFSVEEVADKEESLYASARTGKSLLEYLEDGREDRGYNLRRFRSGLPIEGEATSLVYTLPQDIVYQLLSGQVLDTTLRERLAAMTKERDELAAKLHALPLQEKLAQAPIVANDVGPPQEVVRTPRTRRQRLLDTIDEFSAQVLEMVAGLEREALDVADERAVDRAAVDAASSAVKEAEGKFAESTECLKVAEEERGYLSQERDALRELEQSLTKRLDELGTKAAHPCLGALPSVNQRLSSRLEQTQVLLGDMEGWMSTVEDCYQRARQKVEQAAAEIKKWEHVKQGKERQLNEWLSQESERLLEERESFQALQETLCTSLDAMRDGLMDSWEGKLGGKHLFWERLGGYVVKPEILARPGDWAPAIESFYEMKVTLALTQEMTKFHSTAVRRLKVREDMVKREWKKCVGSIFVPMDLPPPPPPLVGHSDRVWGVAFSWDGRKIASGSADKTVRVWDARTGKVQAVLEGHSDTVTSVAFSPDGEHIVSGSVDNSAMMWDVLGGKVERVLVGHSDSVWAVAFSADGSQIISGSLDKTVRIWDASTGQVQRILVGHTEGVYSVLFLDDGSKIVSGSDDKTVRVWDASTGTAHKILRGDNKVAVAVSADGLWIVTGESGGMVRVLDVITGGVLKALKGHGSYARSVALSRDGSWIVSGSYDKTLRLWDASTGNVRSVLEGHSGSVHAVASSRDGRRIASGSADKTIRVWDMDSLTSLPRET